MRLQNITLATTVLLLGLNAIVTHNAQATTAERSGNTASTASIKYEIAQASEKQESVSDDEMLDALQERQKKDRPRLRKNTQNKGCRSRVGNTFNRRQFPNWR